MCIAGNVRKNLVKQSSSHLGRPESRGKECQSADFLLPVLSELQPKKKAAQSGWVFPVNPLETREDLLNLFHGSKSERADYEDYHYSTQILRVHFLTLFWG